MFELLLLLVILLFFIWHFIRTLRLRGKQVATEPLWVPKEIGWGVSINPKNPLGFRINLITDIAVLVTVFYLIFVIVFS
ncbi:hypothetical protein [Streptococcus dentiloxodontae]